MGEAAKYLASRRFRIRALQGRPGGLIEPGPSALNPSDAAFGVF